MDKRESDYLPEVSCHFESEFCSEWYDPDWKKCDSDDTSLKKLTNFDSINSFLEE